MIELRIQPRGPEERPLLRVNALPADNQANLRAVKVIARAFGVPGSRVSLEHGPRHRIKRFRIAAPRQLPPALVALMPAGTGIGGSAAPDQ